MGYNIVVNNGKINYGIKHFVVDTINDMKQLPPTSQPGSTAYCFATQKKYILDNQGYWREMTSNSSNSGSSTDSDQDVEITYDGGQIGTNDTSTDVGFNGGELSGS